MLSLAAPQVVEASGGVRQLSMADAVRSAGVVLLVKKAAPPTEKRPVFVPYRKQGKPRVAKMETTFIRVEIVEVLGSRMGGLSSTSGGSLLRPGKRHTFSPKSLVPGKVLRIVRSGTITNNSVRARYLADGTRKIPIYRRLRDEVRGEAFAKGKRFVFLGSYSVGYEALRGVGGSGLVSVKQLRKIRRLLKKR